jgi:tetratricopeptide (TPR) repeat protein/transcriptional regulator with XRE-family HTH domain
VKKVPYASPNQQLKQERELRGWSQNDVARQLDVDHYYLSRWERGQTFPSPYYRQKLCAIFGKNADELGLLQHPTRKGQHEPGHASSAESVVASLAPVGAVHDPAIPLLFASSTGLVGRDLLLTQLKENLCSGRKGSAVALNGLPGIGKTTLAAALAQDPDIQAHFADGVLWAGLGPNPDLTGLLSRWGTLLGIAFAQAARLTSSDEWVKALRVIIGTRRFLLVIDDAWSIEAALAFKIGGPHCAYLLTTRFPQLGLQFAPNGATPIGELSEEEGLTLLTQLAPEVMTTDPDNARLLVHSIGGLPLALTITGNYLRTQAYSKQPRRIRAALARLQNVQERLLLTSPLSERSTSLSANIPVSLQTIIAVGERQLSKQAQSALRSLSVFPPKPNSFSEEAAIAVCMIPVEALDELCDAGLLESSEPGRYTLHQVIADYAQFHLTDREASKRLLTYCTNFVAAHTKQFELLEQESLTIVSALRIASEEEYLVGLVRCTAAFAPYLVARGLHVQAEEFLMRTEQAARTLQDQTNLTAILYHLGKIQLDQGKFPVAETYFREGLILARQQADHERVCRCLSWLGVIARYRGDYQEANRYYQEGLALARQTEDRAQLSALLINSAQVAYYRGDYEKGDNYTLEALQIARQIGYLTVVTTALGNLGAMAEEQGRYTQAQAYIQEALQLSKQLGNPVQICYDLVNLGEIALKQGHNDLAEGYLREALVLARQLAHHVLLGDVLAVWGKLQLRQYHMDVAEAVFREIRDMAAEGTLANEAVGCYGLARVAFAQEQHDKARSLGQESLRIFKAIGNRKSTAVEAWLQEVFS